MNVKLLRKVAKHILAEPKRFEMGTYGRREGPEDGGPRCGTVACIAGWAFILSKNIPQKLAARMPLIDRVDGMEAIGINNEQAVLLFYEDSWPEPFKSQYAAAPGRTVKKARVAAKRIEHFIKTKGRE